MSKYRLDTSKLAAEVDLARHKGKPDEVSYRQIATAAGVSPGLFTRLNDGFPPNADGLCSLLMWLNPDARLADYILVGDRAGAPPPAPRRREYETVPAA